jgi:MFS transporter, AAHS family, 3-hydroxyphenylpropionic acid transporter
MSQNVESMHAASARNILVTVALCFAVAVLEGFDIQAIGIAGPKLAPEFGFDPGQMKWIFTTSNIGLVIGATLGGWLADRVGRKPVFIASVLMFGIFTLATSYGNNYPAFLVIRLLTGLGFGAALPNMMAVAAEISSSEKRALTAAAMFCGMPLGGGTSALITQLLPRDYDWRILFIMGGVLPALLAPLLYFFMSETLDRTRSAAASARTTLTALFGEGRAVPTLLLWVIFLPTLLILYLILNWLPILVIANGLDRAIAPQASLAFNYASVVGALSFGVIVDRFGPRWPLGLAYGILLVVLIALGSATQLDLVLLLSGAAGFFLMGANYSLYGVAASYYPQDVRGVGSGASVAVGRIGAIFGPLLAGVLLSGGGNTSTVMQYLAPMAALAGIAVFALSFFRHADLHELSVSRS